MRTHTCALVAQADSALGSPGGSSQVRKLYKRAGKEDDAGESDRCFGALRPLLLLLLLNAVSVETFADNAIGLLRSLHVFVVDDAPFTPGLAGIITGLLGDKVGRAREIRAGVGRAGLTPENLDVCRGATQLLQLLTANWTQEVHFVCLQILQQLVGLYDRIQRESPVRPRPPRAPAASACTCG